MKAPSHYKTKDEAKAACEEYLKTLLDLQEKLGVWEENDDSCVATFIYAHYLTETGSLAKYCHG